MVIGRVQRIPSESVDQRIKNFHWLDLIMGIFEANDKDALIPVPLDLEGNVTEGPGFKKLATPHRGQAQTNDKGAISPRSAKSFNFKKKSFKIGSRLIIVA
jgi:hypothetical protein